MSYLSDSEIGTSLIGAYVSVEKNFIWIEWEIGGTVAICGIAKV